MKALLLAGTAIVISASAMSQTDQAVVSQRGHVSLIPRFQWWSLGSNTRFSELSTSLSAIAPMGRNLSVSFRGSHARTSGDITSISDLADAQLSLNYYAEDAKVVIGCGVNVPTGRRELTREEFTTAVLLSNPAFDLQVPGFGQGWNFSPSLTWAVEITESSVLGLGASYQLKGKFQPLDGSGDYIPGDEILLAGGVDFRLSEISTLATDLLFVAYRPDRFGGQEVYAAGRKVVAGIQFRNLFEEDELVLYARYRTRAKSDVAVAGVLFTETDKTIPDQLDLRVQYLERFSDRLSVRFLLEGQFFEQTAAQFSGFTLFGAGIEPEVTVSPLVSIPVRLRLHVGKQKEGGALTAVDAGAGIVVGF